MSSDAMNATAGRAAAPQVVVHTGRSVWSSWWFRIALVLLGLSVMFNFGLFSAYREYYKALEPPNEHYRSGDKTSSNKLAVLEASGTIMPPLTGRLLNQIKHVAADDDVKGVLLVVDSPGGLVADSHQIYHRIKELSEKKPVFVQMKRMAASGGYYISMGAGPKGRIFVEPTTWTGSIGVIIPRYDVSKLSDQFGIASDPLKTGEFKDALSPFRPLSENERKLWDNILQQSFSQFLSVIDENRDKLDADAVRALATGQIYTAKDAVANGLVDQIGFEDDAIKALREQLGLASARVIEYETPFSITDILLGSAKAHSSRSAWESVLETTVPQAYFYCSWLPALPR